MRLLVIIFLVFFFMSCKKDVAVPAANSSVAFDTLYPNSYLPAYPGSYWKYMDSNGDTSGIYTGTYIKDCYCIAYKNFFGQPVTYQVVSDTVFVPQYNGECLWGYSLNKHFSNYGYGNTLRRAVADSFAVNTKWQYSSSYINGTTSTKSIMVFAKDTTIVINNTTYYPVIVMDDLFYPVTPSPVITNRYYYAKNIGLIKHEIFSFFPQQSITKTILLQSYFINN